MSLKHGHSSPKTLTYNTWRALRRRCNDPKDSSYPQYGGKGISVSDRWNTYTNFLADMGEKPGRGYSIERIDNNGPYSPDNCKWATTKEQNNNKSDTHIIEYQGEKITISELAARTGLPHRRLAKRITVQGWTAERAVSAPLMSCKLDQNKVAEIRSLLGSGLLQKEIGPMFGIKQATVSKIALGLIWSGGYPDGGR